MGQGPLSGVKVIEFAGIGPGPFCGMLLADLGADVLRIDRKSEQSAGRGTVDSPFFIASRGKRSVALDLKHAKARDACLDMFERAEIVFEGFRPGVMERLGLGPSVALSRNPRLVYGRMTGWGQYGPLSQAAGHDINYIALSGALHAIGVEDKPAPPLNLVGDFGGGALYLAFGMMAALLHARASGQGQVVDAAMTDGAASLMTMFYSFKAGGLWQDSRRSNLIDGGAHFYDTYQCADGAWIALGAIEPQFYALLLEKAGLDDPAFRRQMDRSQWPSLRARVADTFARKTRSEWCEIMEGTDICFAPVLTLEEAPEHPHNRARETFLTIDGVIQPAPAPRFSETPGKVCSPPSVTGDRTQDALADWGFSGAEVAALKTSGAVA